MGEENNPRKFWLQIALTFFPHRHSKLSAVRQNSRGMLYSMFNHGKNWRLWKAGKLNINHNIDS